MGTPFGELPAKVIMGSSSGQRSVDTVGNNSPVDVQSRSVTEPQRDGVVLDDGGDKEKAD